MAVKVITDSVSDLPVSVAQEWGITIIPQYTLFGNEAYRDGVDLTTEEFYRRLVSSSVLPTTSAPPASEILEVFNKLAEETDEIVFVAMNAKYGAIYDNALLAKEMVTKPCRIEVIDSTFAIMSEGFAAIAAAEAAQRGANLDEVVAAVRHALPRIHSRMSFDTLEYLKKGGRIGRAEAFMGSLLKVNPILTFDENGETVPVARVRSRAKAIDWLYNFVAGFKNIKGLAIEDATTPDDVEELARRIDPIFPRERIIFTKVGTVTGTHVGPHVLSVAVWEGEG
jgi:DegV family protein with EDD domain